MKTEAQKQAETDKEADREMETGAQKQAETDKEADREMETGAEYLLLAPDKFPTRTSHQTSLKSDLV